MTSALAAREDGFVHPENFVTCLKRLVSTRPDDVALIVVALRGDQFVENVLSYGQFGQRVQALAATLQASFECGDRVLLLLDNDEHYAVSMFACFYAGVIAVPAFPPESMRAQHLARLIGIATDAKACGILAANRMKALVDATVSQFGVSTVIAVDEVDPVLANSWRPCQPAEDDVAFLQYTSGSTSAPKGVMVTHANLVANERAIRERLSIGADDKFGTWSPLFHDMGLIGGLLQPFYSGIPCVLCSPRFFLERPVRWLELISRHRVTISGGPDFAYRLCLDRVTESQVEGLDLTCWRVAYTGAEPVRHDTMEAFIERYSSRGFNAAAVYPCYGLAEATLLVTGGRRGGGMAVRHVDDEALAMQQVVIGAGGAAQVSCGIVPTAHDIRIVDPLTGDVAVDGVGEIWAAGPSIAAGYWNNPCATADTFVTRDGLRWLRTGDLGFMHDGELFVAGRLKDMIIVRGHNIFPQDIERAIEAEVEAVRKGRVAAFAVNHTGLEGIGIAAEVPRGLQKRVPAQVLVDSLSATVSAQCGEAPKVVVLLNPGALPKTSSGKLQRSACRQGYIEHSLDAYAIFENGMPVADASLAGGAVADLIDTAEEDTTKALAGMWRDVLGHDAARLYSPESHFFALGGNSLAAVQLVVRIAQYWAIDFPLRQIFDRPRMRQQTEAISAALEDGVRALVPAIPRLSAERRDGPLPLSSAQRRQWFLWRLDPQSTAYHMQGALRIHGVVDVEAMRAAVADLAKRHDSLRTVFRVLPDGEAGQCVHLDGNLSLQVVDLRSAASDERENCALQSLHAIHAPPYDLTRGPLVRAALVHQQDKVSLVMLAMHHIVSDGISMQILIEDLAALYHGRASAEVCAPPPPQLQYTDFVVWQQEQPDQGLLERQLLYWCGQLRVPASETQPVLALPTDHPRQAVARYRAGHYRFQLPDRIVTGLRGQAELQGVTLFMQLLAAFQALLYRHSGQRDIRVGVPMANRAHPALHNVVGFFVNTLVLRNDINGRMSLAQVLASVKDAALDAQAHQDLPFERLVEALQPERSLTHSPLFQVMFNHLQENLGALARRLGLAVEALWLPDQEAQFELTLDTREQPDGSVSAHITYASELFEPSRIERLARHYLMLLKAMVEHPEQALGDISILDADELRQLERLGSNPLGDTCVEPIHRLIAQQAAVRPQATALVLGEQSLSYAALECRANRLAHRLLALGVMPGNCVGLALERSLDMVVGLLAILKAGGVLVPLDPDYPTHRLAAMAQDSQVRRVLTHSHVRCRLPTAWSEIALVVDEFDLDAGPDHAPEVALHAESLAYVIYTSGSTGTPKGVAVAHHALTEHTRLSAVFSSLTPQDRMLQFATLNFDGFVEQLFPPLLVGATVVLRGPVLWGPDEFLRELRKRRISIVDLPTAYWFALIQSFADAESHDYGSLREVHIGGEAMPAEAVPVWNKAGLSAVKLLNTYGPTEAVVVASLLDCAPYISSERALPRQMPIGAPLPGRCLHVLDGDLRQVSVGVSGELYIGGPLLAHGYLNLPGLTAERFVADPFDAAGGRVYRTGDRVRWNAHGELEYLGRIDDQVKIRGFRIEPGEIEAQLLAQPEVRQAVIVARPGPHGTQLVAYAAAHPGQSIDAAELRVRLTGTLPDYMVPSAIVTLDVLPMNANGKVDRHALPEPERPAGLMFEAPEGETEAVLARLWADLLGIERVGRNDNFFELGGHSLLLLKLHQHLQEQGFAVKAAVVDLFRYPTIGTLAAFLVAANAGGTTREDNQQQIIARATRQRQTFLPRRSQRERTSA